MKNEAERLGTKDDIDDASPSDQQFTAGREVSDEEAAIDVPEVAEDHGAAAEDAGVDGAVGVGAAALALGAGAARAPVPARGVRRALVHGRHLCCGDAHRAGLIYGLLNDLDLVTTCRIGSLMGAIKIAHQGPQNHTPSLGEIEQRFLDAYGYRF